MDGLGAWGGEGGEGGRGGRDGDLNVDAAWDWTRTMGSLRAFLAGVGFGTWSSRTLASTFPQFPLDPSTRPPWLETA
jgi:hypothetical protein